MTALNPFADNEQTDKKFPYRQASAPPIVMQQEFHRDMKHTASRFFFAKKTNCIISQKVKTNKQQ